MTAERTVRLDSGRLTLSVAQSDWPLDRLCGFAARRNPRRGFLIVSKVLGRHVPARPSEMRASLRDLAAKVPADLPGPALVVGLAETAVGLGHGLFEELHGRGLRGGFLHSTRQIVDAPLLGRFQEPHSHASAHLLYRPAEIDLAAVRSLIVVDDEISTGTTLVNLAQALVPVLPACEAIVVAALTDWSGSAAWLERMPRPARCVSLLRGRLDWAPDAPPAQDDAFDAAAGALGTLSGGGPFGRLGLADPAGFRLPDLGALSLPPAERGAGRRHRRVHLSSAAARRAARGCRARRGRAGDVPQPRPPRRGDRPCARLRGQLWQRDRQFPVQCRSGGGTACPDLPRNSARHGRSGAGIGAAGEDDLLWRERLVRAIALVDLDDTLFQTLGKCPPDVPAEALVPIGYARDGAPLSYATPRQLSFLSWLSDSTLLVPVTARSRDALDRVRISWTCAICAHGGVILDADGGSDSRWHARMAAEADAHAASLSVLSQRIIDEARAARRCGCGCSRRTGCRSTSWPSIRTETSDGARRRDRQGGARGAGGMDRPPQRQQRRLPAALPRQAACGRVPDAASFAAAIPTRR